MVTERKKVQGLRLADLGADAGVRVQGVDVDAWSRGAVRVNEEHVITGSKTFLGPHSSADVR